MLWNVSSIGHCTPLTTHNGHVFLGLFDLTIVQKSTHPRAKICMPILKIMETIIICDVWVLVIVPGGVPVRNLGEPSNVSQNFQTVSKMGTITCAWFHNT